MVKLEHCSHRNRAHERTNRSVSRRSPVAAFRSKEKKNKTPTANPQDIQATRAADMEQTRIGGERRVCDVRAREERLGRLGRGESRTFFLSRTYSPPLRFCDPHAHDLLMQLQESVEDDLRLFAERSDHTEVRLLFLLPLFLPSCAQSLTFVESRPCRASYSHLPSRRASLASRRALSSTCGMSSPRRSSGRQACWRTRAAGRGRIPR